MWVALVAVLSSFALTWLVFRGWTKYHRVTTRAVPYVLTCAFCVLTVPCGIWFDNLFDRVNARPSLVLVPILLVVGWVLGVRRSTSNSFPLALSSVGLSFSTAAMPLAVWAIANAKFLHAHYYHDALAYCALGEVLGMGGLALGILGMWRSHHLRWNTPLCGIATIVFWWSAAASGWMGEMLNIG